MEKEREYQLVFTDGPVLVPVSFLEDHSEMCRDLKNCYTTNPESIVLPEEMLSSDWDTYYSLVTKTHRDGMEIKPSLIKLMRFLLLKHQEILEIIFNEKDFTEEEIRKRVYSFPLKDIAHSIPYIPINYGEKTIDIALDLLSRSDEILETNNTYLPVPIPDDFPSLLDKFMKGRVWRPTEGVILSGGALMTLLFNREFNSVSEEEDLDLWIYGPNEEERKKRQNSLILSLIEGRDVLGIWDKTGTKSTLNYRDGGRTIQVIRTEYTVPSQIPNFFDINCTKAYYGTEGLFLHVECMRALRFGRISLDLETIKRNRLLKCLRYDFTTPNNLPLWKEAVEFLERNETPRLGVVPHLPNHHNLARLREYFTEKIDSKEDLISFLLSHTSSRSKGQIVQSLDNEGYTYEKRKNSRLPECCSWQIMDNPYEDRDDYPLSIREKALIISLNDPDNMKEVILERIRTATHGEPIEIQKHGRISFFYSISSPIVIRFHGLVIRKSREGYYASFSPEENRLNNPYNGFLIELSDTFLSRFQNLNINRLMKYYDYWDTPKWTISIPINILDVSQLTSSMVVDLDLSINGFTCNDDIRIVQNMNFINLSIKKNVIGMKILKHLE